MFDTSKQSRRTKLAVSNLISVLRLHVLFVCKAIQFGQWLLDISLVRIHNSSVYLVFLLTCTL